MVCAVALGQRFDNNRRTNRGSDTAVSVKLATPGHFSSGGTEFGGFDNFQNNEFQSQQGFFQQGGQSGTSFRSGSFNNKNQFQNSAFRQQQHNHQSFNQKNRFQNQFRSNQGSYNQNNRFQSGSSSFIQNNRFQSGSSFNQNQKINSGSPFNQNHRFQSGSSFNQNNRFQSGSSFNQNQRSQTSFRNNQQQTAVLSSRPSTSFKSQSFNNFNNQQQQFRSQNSNRQLNQGSQNTFSAGFYQGSQSASGTGFFGQNVETFGVFEPLNLPSGASARLGSIDTSFSCVDLPYGFYADQANDCRVFHVCNPALYEDEHVETYQYRWIFWFFNVKKNENAIINSLSYYSNTIK